MHTISRSVNMRKGKNIYRVNLNSSCNTSFLQTLGFMLLHPLCELSYVSDSFYEYLFEL